MDKDNLFYEINDPICATVGTNGCHTISDYADGFFEGAEFIIYECLTRLENRKNFDPNNRINITEDIIVYPICFNIRHSIELYLKEIIENLFLIYQTKGIYGIELKSIEHHDINKLWGIIKNAHFGNWQKDSIIKREFLFDERFDSYVDDLDKYVTDWGNLDPTGQTFRYPFSSESKRHLENQNVICVLSLFLKSKEFHEKLKKFREFSYALKDEYQNNKFTRFLTYKQLSDICKCLPNIKEWPVSDLEKIINELCINYKMPSIRSIKESAINKKIKKDYFLSSLIGIDIPFKFFSNEKILDVYLFFNSIDADLLELQKSKDYSELFRKGMLVDNKIKSFLLNYSECELYDLLTLIYIGRDNEDLNNYEKVFSFMKNNFVTKDEVLRKIIEKKGNIKFYIECVMKIFGKNIL